MHLSIHNITFFKYEKILIPTFLLDFLQFCLETVWNTSLTNQTLWWVMSVCSDICLSLESEECEVIDIYSQQVSVLPHNSSRTRISTEVCLHHTCSVIKLYSKLLQNVITGKLIKSTYLIKSTLTSVFSVWNHASVRNTSTTQQAEKALQNHNWPVTHHPRW